MVQCRFKDKFIVVSEAPWQVYDQIELDIFPSSLQLTKNLYIQFKKFFFDYYYNPPKNKQDIIQNKDGAELLKESDRKDMIAGDKKYLLLVPNKI